MTTFVEFSDGVRRPRPRYSDEYEAPPPRSRRYDSNATPRRPQFQGDAIYPRFDGEPIELLLKRFKKATHLSGVLGEARRHAHFSTRRQRKRSKRKAAAYGRQRQQRQQP